MFYDAVKNAHGLKFDPFKALIAPRPIGWISTVDRDGIANLAPYSFFNMVSNDPHYVMFSSGGRKDSQRNAEETGEFVCSLATFDLREEMNRTGAFAAPEIDEMALAGLTPAQCNIVKPPRVSESPVALECHYFKTVQLPGFPDADGNPTTGNYSMVIGQVVGIHIDDNAIIDGMVDVPKLGTIARLGYLDYMVVDKSFSLQPAKSPS